MWHVVYGGPCFSFSSLALLADCMDVVVLFFVGIRCAWLLLRLLLRLFMAYVARFSSIVVGMMLLLCLCVY